MLSSSCGRGNGWCWLTALLGGLIAALLASQTPPSYESEAKVLVKPVVLSSTDPTQTINANMDTEAELADSETVARYRERGPETRRGTPRAARGSRRQRGGRHRDLVIRVPRA